MLIMPTPMDATRPPADNRSHMNSRKKVRLPLRLRYSIGMNSRPGISTPPIDIGLDDFSILKSAGGLLEPLNICDAVNKAKKIIPSPKTMSRYPTTFSEFIFNKLLIWFSI